MKRRFEITNIQETTSKTQVVLLMLSFICFVSMTIFPIQSRSSEKLEPCFFFPYESCALFKIIGIQRSNAIDSPTIVAKAETVLRGNLKSDQKIRLILESNPKDLFGLSAGTGLLGSRQLMAFHQASTKEDTILSTFNEYVPIKNSQFLDREVIRLQDNLKKTPYPYRSCLVVTGEKLRSNHERKSYWHSKDLLLRVDSVVVEDQKYAAEGVKNVENQNKYKELAIDHYEFKPKDLINVEVQWFQLSENPPRLPKNILSGQKYILLWNPCQHPTSQIPNTFLDASIELSPFQPQEIQRIKALARKNPEKLDSLRRQLESHIKRRWTVQRIREYLNRPELRECPPFRDVEPSNGPVLGGQLYSKQESELGKVIWYTWLQDMQPVGQFQVDVTNKTGDVWKLELDFFGLQEYSDDQFVQDLLALTLRRSLQAFWMIQNYKLAQEPKSVVQVDIPEPAFARLQLLRDSNKRIKSARFTLTNGKILTADVDADLRLSNILVDGRVCEPWTEAYDNRVQNMNEIWKRVRESQ